VLLVDSASFVVFALAAARVRRPLRPQITVAAAYAEAPSLTSLARDRVIVGTSPVVTEDADREPR
jgi:hypothetical protein